MCTKIFQKIAILFTILVLFIGVGSFIFTPVLVMSQPDGGADVDNPTWVYTLNVNDAYLLPSTDGTASQVLQTDGSGTITWETQASGFADPMTTRGDLIFKNAGGTTTRLPAGTTDYVLTSDGTDISWEAASGSVTTEKDLVTTAPLTGGEDDILVGADSDVTLAITVAKDLVTTAPLTGGTDNILTGSDADITIALTQLKDIVTTAPLTGGENDVLPGADADLTLAITVQKDLVGTSPLSVSGDNILPGADADVTISIADADDDGVTKGAAAFENTDFNATAGVVTIVNSGIDHDQTTNFVANEHLDWTGDLGATNIHANNYVESDPNALLTVGTNNVNDTHLDWGVGANQVSAVDLPIADAGVIITGTEVETALQENRTAINLNTSKVTESSTVGDTASLDLTLSTYAISGAVLPAGVDHDSLSNFVANEHLDWTQDLGATNIHAGNYTDTDTTYTGGDAITLAGTTFNFDGGATPGGELGNTWASPTINADAVLWNEVGDSGADSTIALAGYEHVFSSSLDEAAHVAVKIDHTDADVTAATTLLQIDSVDDADVDITYLKIRDDSGGTPNTLFSVESDLIQIQTSTNATTGFQVLQADGTPSMILDTVNNRLTVGTTIQTYLGYFYRVGWAEMMVFNDGGGAGAGYRVKDTTSGAEWVFKTDVSGNFKLQDITNTRDQLYLLDDGRVGVSIDAVAASQAWITDSVGLFTIDGGGLELLELSADPSDPAEGRVVIWLSDGTGAGDDGDVMFKITAGGSTKSGTLLDFSTF